MAYRDTVITLQLIKSVFSWKNDWSGYCRMIYGEFFFIFYIRCIHTSARLIENGYMSVFLKCFFFLLGEKKDNISVAWNRQLFNQGLGWNLAEAWCVWISIATSRKLKWEIFLFAGYCVFFFFLQVSYICADGLRYGTGTWKLHQSCLPSPCPAVYVNKAVRVNNELLQLLECFCLFVSSGRSHCCDSC